MNFQGHWFSKNQRIVYSFLVIFFIIAYLIDSLTLAFTTCYKLPVETHSIIYIIFKEEEVSSKWSIMYNIQSLQEAHLKFDFYCKWPTAKIIWTQLWLL